MILEPDYRSKEEKTNEDLNILSKQIRKAEVLGDTKIKEYFEELRTITLERFTKYTLKKANEQPMFVKDRGSFYYD